MDRLCGEFAKRHRQQQLAAVRGGQTGPQAVGHRTIPVGQSPPHLLLGGQTVRPGSRRSPRQRGRHRACRGRRRSARTADDFIDNPHGFPGVQLNGPWLDGGQGVGRGLPVTDDAIRTDTGRIERHLEPTTGGHERRTSEDVLQHGASDRDRIGSDASWGHRRRPWRTATGVARLLRIDEHELGDRSSRQRRGRSLRGLPLRQRGTPFRAAPLQGIGVRRGHDPLRATLATANGGDESECRIEVGKPRHRLARQFGQQRSERGGIGPQRHQPRPLATDNQRQSIGSPHLTDHAAKSPAQPLPRERCRRAGGLVEHEHGIERG